MFSSDLTLSAVETPIQKMTKEDYIILLLEKMLHIQIEMEGETSRLFCLEGDLAAGATATVAADFVHDAWMVYFRSEPNAVLRVWPGGTPPASGAIEIRNGTSCRIKSTNNQLYLTNTGTVACHFFAIALSLAEVEFFSM